MMKELFNEQKEDLFNLAKNGCTDSNVKDYCVENNVPYRLAQDFLTETYQYLNNCDIN